MSFGIDEHRRLMRQSLRTAGISRRGERALITIDMENGVLTVEDSGGAVSYGLGTPVAFDIISKAWLRSGWDAKYVYSFSWMGRPIIQLPEDLIRIQEVIYGVKPDLIIETGIAHGGSLIFYASLCKAMGKGRVIGVDIEIRPENKMAIEAHELFSFLTLIEGDSVDPAVVARVKAELGPSQRVLVLLDSRHTKQHVLAELEAYSPLICPGSYIVAMDGIMEEVVGAPRTEADWVWNNPKAAAVEFVEHHPDFAIEEPRFPFNEGVIEKRVTYWPSAFVKRITGQ